MNVSMQLPGKCRRGNVSSPDNRDLVFNAMLLALLMSTRSASAASRIALSSSRYNIDTIPQIR